MCSQFSGISEKKQCKNNKFFACYQFSALVEKAASEKSSSRLGNESVDSSGSEGFVRKFPCHCPFGTMECDFRFVGRLCGNTKIERCRGRFQLQGRDGQRVGLTAPAAPFYCVEFVRAAEPETKNAHIQISRLPSPRLISADRQKPPHFPGRKPHRPHSTKVPPFHRFLSQVQL